MGGGGVSGLVVQQFEYQILLLEHSCIFSIFQIKSTLVSITCPHPKLIDTQINNLVH